MRWRALTIAQKEYLQIRRDPITLAFALAIPVMFLLLFVYTYKLDEKHIRTAVYDMDRTPRSRDYLAALGNTEYFALRYFIGSYREAKHLLDKGSARVVLVIPPGFSRALDRGRPAHIQTLIDGAFSNTAQLAVNYIAAINAAYSSRLSTHRAVRDGTPGQVCRIDSRVWYNPQMDNDVSMIIGLFTAIIMSFPPLLAALAIVKEREKGTIQQIYASPIRPYEYIAGKVIPYMVIAFLGMSIVWAVGIFGFGLPFRGNALFLAVAILIYTIATVLLGVIVSAVTQSQVTALILGIQVSFMPAFIFSDAIIAISNMPAFFQVYTYLFPGRLFSGIAEGSFIKGTRVVDLLDNLLYLTLYTLIAFVLATLLIRKKQIR